MEDLGKEKAVAFPRWDIIIFLRFLRFVFLLFGCWKFLPRQKKAIRFLAIAFIPMHGMEIVGKDFVHLCLALLPQHLI